MRQVSSRYEGGDGEEYFAWQREMGRAGARLNLAKFEPYVRPEDHVVDFGCGGGYLLELLPAAGRMGIEPNPAARTAGLERGLDIRATTGEVESDTIDLAISNHALEHTLSPWNELRGLHRVLRPQGRLALVLPLDDWRTQRHADISDVNHHLYAWTPLLIGNLLADAGFQHVEATVFTHAWPPKYDVLFDRLPRPAFDAIASGWAIARRRRQIVATAIKT